MRCWFFHRWTRWRDVTHYQLRDNGRDCGLSVVQHRECLDCGKKESREVPA